MKKHVRFSPIEEVDAVEQAARHNHYEGEIPAESFWRTAAASLPPQARRRYLHLFEAAERWEPVVEHFVDRVSDFSHAVGRLFHAAPQRRRRATTGQFHRIRRA